MPASSNTRALLLGLAALALAAGGFVIGRRLSAPEATPQPSASAGDRDPGAAREPMAAPPPVRRPDPAAADPAPVEPPGRSDGVRVDPRGASAPRAARPGPRTAPTPAVPPAAARGSEPDDPLEPQGAAGGRGFVAGLTQIGSTRAARADLKGFDPAAVALKRAPETDGAIEFEVVPTQVQPGQPYVVKVYLRNRGDKPIRVKALSVASEMNGRSSRGSLSPHSKAVEPSLVGLLAELPGVWKSDVSSWSIAVDVLTTAGDTYSSRVAWK